MMPVQDTDTPNSMTAKETKSVAETNNQPNMSSQSDASAPARPGNLIVLTGPSGVGKGTLRKELLLRVPNLVRSVSVTTREKRPGETEGIDYFFRNKEEFNEMRAADQLMEFAEFAGSYYGTPRNWVLSQIKQGNDVLLEIEVQGAKQIRQRFPQTLLIFVSPPSFESLRERLQNRATESAEKIAQRLKKAEVEMNEKQLFYYEVINDNIGEAVNNLVHIVYAERCRIRKQPKT